MVSWRHRAISVALLGALIGLPVAAATCALLCGSGVSTSAHHAAATHHGSGHTGAKNCQESPTAGDVRIGGIAEHDCTHDVTIRQDASFAADRADAGLRSAPAVSPIDDHLIVGLDFAPESPGNRPPGSAPPTSTPLVLRV